MKIPNIFIFKENSTMRYFALRTVILLAVVLIGCAAQKPLGQDSVIIDTPAMDKCVIPMRGMYMYMADAGVFIDCLTEKKWSVAQEGDNAALESAYLKDRLAPGKTLMVTFEGHFAMRPKMDGPGQEKVVIVDRFDQTWPIETCEGRLLPVQLKNTLWKLVELAGKAVTVHQNQKEPYFLINSKDNKIEGFSGCNHFFGAYQIDDEAIRFGPIGSTRMACPEEINVEFSFFQALESATTYKISGDVLDLYSGDKLLARFKAVFLK